MYFNNKNNTNIDEEFNNNNIVSNLLSLISKYKLIIIIAIVLLISIPTILYFVNNSKDNYKIVLSGEDTITIYKDSEYIEPGYKVYDSNGEEYTGKISIISTVDTKNTGEYEIMYSLGDISKIRKIIVIDKPKEYVYIYLTPVNNSTHIYLKTGETYKEPGYKVLSTTGKDLTSRVKVTGNVDTKTPGTYKLTYSITDDNGVTTSETRNVIVMNTEISLTLNKQEYTNKEVIINVGVVDNYFDYMILPNGEKKTTSSYEYKVTSNGNYTFKAYNKKGNVKESSIEVKNIDKEAPTGSCSGSYSNGKSLINVTANDSSGIDKYVINGISYSNNQININSELKTVNITIYDKAGNTKNISCNLENKNIEPSKPSSNKPSSSSKPSSSASKPSSSKPSSSSGTEIKKGENLFVNYYKNFTYWLYVPNKTTKNLPIVVYLPGLGERGNDYHSGAMTGIAWGPINEIKDHGHRYNAIVIHMQVPGGQSVYGYLDNYVNLINEIADEYGANKNKISIIGLSHGCYGLVEMLQKYPKYYSSAVFVGCAPNKRNDINKFTSTKIWTFVGGGDGTGDYNDEYGSHYSLQNFVNKINEAGGDARHTSVKEKANVHNIMNDNYSILRDNDYNVINWMISQSR